MQKIVLIIFFIGSILNASNEIIRGYVKNFTDKSTIQNVNIIIKDTNIGTVSDQDGYYYLKVKNYKDKEIVFSCIGYESSVIPISKFNTNKNHDVFLKSTDICLEECTITATLEKRFLKDITTKVEVKRVTNTDLQNFEVANIVNDFAGIIVEPNGYSKNIVKINGLPAKYSLVLIDGERVKGGHGGIDLSQITLDNVEKIEVVKGPTSSLYGSDAIAGVINVITKEPQDGFKLKTGYSRENFNTNIYQLSTNYSFKKLRINLGGSRLETDGETVPEGYSSNNFFVKSIYGTKNKLKFSYKGFVEKRNLYNMKEYKNSVKFSQDVDLEEDGKISQAAYTNSYKRSLLAQGKITTSHERDLNFKLTYSNYWSKDNLFILGYEFLHKHYDGHIIKDHDYTNSLFAQSDFSFGDFRFTLGSRGDYHRTWGYSINPKINLMYVYKELTVRASCGKGFKAPSLSQLHSFWFHAPGGGIWIQGNEKLDPEKSIGCNLNFSYLFLNSLKIYCDLFFNSINDIIISDKIGTHGGHNLYSYFNKENLDTYGNSLTLEYNFLNYYLSRLNYDYTTTTKNYKLPNTPSHQLRFSIGISKYPLLNNILKLSTDLKCKYRGLSYLDSKNTIEIDDSIITSLSTDIALYDNIHFGLLIDNIFDCEYKIYDKMPGRIIKGSISYEY